MGKYKASARLFPSALYSVPDSVDSLTKTDRRRHDLVSVGSVPTLACHTDTVDVYVV